MPSRLQIEQEEFAREFCYGSFAAELREELDTYAIWHAADLTCTPEFRLCQLIVECSIWVDRFKHTAVYPVGLDLLREPEIRLRLAETIVRHLVLNLALVKRGVTP